MKKAIVTLTILLFMSQGIFSQVVLTKDERMEWWREARFGMFIHWGVYSIPAGTWDGRQIGGIGEWIMNRGKIPVADYQRMAKQFNPVNYDPDAWVRMAKDAGMKYIVITSKHHDGFALFESKASKWNVVDATEYGKDLLKPLAEACKKYGIKLGFYYSQAQDWNNPGGSAARRPAKEGWANPDSVIIDAYTKEHNGHWDPAQEKKTFAQYIDDVAVPQVREILTNYGEIAVLWWDTPTNMTDEAATKLQSLLSLQPDIITNDRLKRPNFPGDHKTPEQRIPNLKDLDGTDWETCMTMNGTWGYKSYDHNYKSPETLIHNLLDIASKGGNFLLNAGPTDLGEFPRESIDILAKIGEWMKVNGEAVYGTKASPWGLFPWGRCTSKETKSGTTLYFSVFEWPADGKITIPDLAGKVVSAKLISTGATLKTATSKDGALTISLPSKATDPIATVVKVEVKGKVAAKPPAAFSAPALLDLSGPDGRLHCLLATEADQLTLSVTMNRKLILEPSPLLMSVDGTVITSGIKSGKINKFMSDKTYPVYGPHSIARDNYDGAFIPLTHIKSGIEYNLEIKVFNDAVAFRFVVPGKESSVRMPDEATAFRLPSGSMVWCHDLYMHYEGVHTKKLIDTVPAGQWAAPPLMVKLPESTGYVAITEANLVNYAGMALQSNGKNGFALRLGHSHPASYPYVLRYSKEDVERLSEIAGVKGTITTPWRVVMAGSDLNTMVNCDAIGNLCPPPDKINFPEGIKTEWIRPGRAVWKYLDGGGDGTLQVMKEFSGEAAELGFEYNILEGFWSRWPDDSVKALVDYSNKLGVGIIVWKHSKDLREPEERKEFFQRLHDLGVAGIKIDFFDHEAKEVIDLYESIARECAALKLSLIFHGANKPTGLQRTWPNILIYEGVKGMEASKLMDRATHETTIPFTRMLAGGADYSVCHFGDRRRNTTWVHQAASAAIYSAPVITYASTPAHILGNPCSGMIRSIPSAWDETIVLPGSEPGELAAFARRKGTTWFLSVINGLQPTTVKIPLSFLKNGTYSTLVLNDNPEDPAAAIVSYGSAKRDDIVDITMGEGGGFMTRFTLK